MLEHQISENDNIGFSTRAIHSGQEASQWTSLAVVPPIVMSSTFAQFEPAVTAVLRLRRLYIAWVAKLRLASRMLIHFKLDYHPWYIVNCIVKQTSNNLFNMIFV